MKGTLLNLLFLLIIGGLFHISPVSAQSKKLDSLYAVLKTQKEDTNRVNTLNIISSILEEGNHDSIAVSFNLRAIQLAEKLNYKKGLGSAYRIQGFIYIDKGDNDEAIKSQTNALKIAQEMGDKEAIANAYGNIGSAYRYKGKYNEALQYQNKTLEIDEEIGNKKGICTTLANIGSIDEDMGNYPEALKNLAQALKIDEERGDETNAGIDYGTMGNIYFDQSNYSEALKCQAKALEIFKKLGNNLEISRVYSNIGNIFSYQGNYPEALKYHLLGLKADEALNSKRGLETDYGNIGNVYHDLGNHKEALKNYELSLKYTLEINDKTSLGAAYSNIAGEYFANNNFTDALKMELRSLAIADSIGDKAQIANANENIGSIYGMLGRNADALKSQMTALAIYKQIGFNYGMSNAYMDIGNTLVKQKKYNMAGHYLDSALTLSTRTGNKDVIRGSYQSKAVYDSTVGNYRAAFNDYRNYIGYRDSLINEKNTKKLVQEQMQYDFDKQQATQKAAQEQKDALSAQDRKKQIIIRNFFIWGFILVLALAFFIFRGYREKQKANEIITKQKEEVEQQKELVEEKQKEIVDSIHYAERIQKALLASEDLLKENLPEYFVLYKPKDIVSGDFYWATKKGNQFYLAVCDSTGHGVPGAFMSLLNISFLNEAINEKGIEEPNKVLDHTRRRLIENISQEGGQDGMDGVLVTIRETKEGKELRYAAAYNKPIVIRDDEAIELDADKMPVGKSPKDGEGFTEYTVSLQKGDMIYLYTDGYGDQFGGEKGKKYKYTQLKEKLKTISKGSMEEQRKILDKEFESWRHMLEQTDDVCVMGIRV